jgi:hypothetical protein
MKEIVKNSFNFVMAQFTVFNHVETEYEIYSASLEPKFYYTRRDFCSFGEPN